MKLPQNRILKSLVGVMAVLSLVACTPESTPDSTPVVEMGYPGIQSQNELNNAYPMGNFVPTLEKGEFPEIPADIPIPEPGKGSITGVLYSYKTNSIIANTQFYLTPAKGAETGEIPLVLIGPNTEKGDLADWSNSKGQILVNNIPPGKYYLAIWAPMTWVAAETEAKDGTLLLIDINADQTLELGVINASWP